MILILVKDKKRRINGFQAMEADLTQKTPNSGAEPLTIKLTLIQDVKKCSDSLLLHKVKR